MAFLLCVGFCGYSVMRKVGSSVGCPLTRRYVYSCNVAVLVFVTVNAVSFFFSWYQSVNDESE